MGEQVPHHLFHDHSRHWKTFDYVYPVVSRRSKGLSIGINLNVDDACNFDCVYCQVDRTQPPARRDVDLDQLRDELDTMLQFVISGAIWSDPAFADTPLKLRRVNDIAFSGNGEPTASPQFAQACRIVTDLRNKHVMSTTKIVLITNATLLHRPTVRDTLALLDQHMGEIWAKLDAGTQKYFELIDRPRGGLKLDQILRNIADAGRIRPLVIQSMFCQVHGQATPLEEFEAYLNRLYELIEGGCQVDRVQMYTVARDTAEPYAEALTDAELNMLAERLRSRLPSLGCEVFYG